MPRPKTDSFGSAPPLSVLSGPPKNAADPAPAGLTPGAGRLRPNRKSTTTASVNSSLVRRSRSRSRLGKRTWLTLRARAAAGNGRYRVLSNGDYPEAAYAAGSAVPRHLGQPGGRGHAAAGPGRQRGPEPGPLPEAGPEPARSRFH